MMDKNLKREIIIDHYQYPRNKKSISEALFKIKHRASDSCIDDIKVGMIFDQGRIIDIKFDGIGCAISTATTSIFTELLKNKKKEEALKLIDNYLNMLDEKSYDESLLAELEAFDELSKQANRIKCGKIGVLAMKELIEEYE